MSSVSTLAPVGCLPTGGSSRTALQAELSRAQIQYADWSHCPSAKTPEGKAKVDELASQISADQARLNALGSMVDTYA